MSLAVLPIHPFPHQVSREWHSTGCLGQEIINNLLLTVVDYLHNGFLFHFTDNDKNSEKTSGKLESTLFANDQQGETALHVAYHKMSAHREKNAGATVCSQH